MTCEEAIIRFERQLKAAQAVLDSGFGSNLGENDRIYRERKEMAKIAIAALRGPTREQVEKVWKGEWINKHSAYDHKIFTCAQCGKQISIQGENLDFCPKCGSTQTDEAVDILLKRLEALKDGTKSDRQG